MTEKQLQALILGRQKGIIRNRPKGLKYIKHKENPSSFKKGMTPWNKGIRGEFKGITKDGLHDWVERNLGKAKEGICEKCGSDKKLQWSNISGLYNHTLSDWQILCIKCHINYDFENFGARQRIFKRNFI